MKKTCLILFIIFTAYSNTYAAGVDIFTPKKQTPKGLIINELSKPEIFSTGNDLTRKVGSFNVAIGEQLYIKGTVTDAFGVPIEGATIKIWQTNASGNYQDLLKPDSNYIDKNFVMSGTARTDNLGRYGFKTIFPGFVKDRAPHVNIVISHPNFGEIETEIYFENHPDNDKDPQYMSYSKEDREALTAKVLNVDYQNLEEGKMAIFDIVMDGIHSYKGY